MPNLAATLLGGRDRAPTATYPGCRGHAPDGSRAHETPPDLESCGGKGYVPNPATTLLGGRDRVPTATRPRGRGHVPDGRRAHEMPSIQNPAEVRAACLTLWQPGVGTSFSLL